MSGTLFTPKYKVYIFLKKSDALLDKIQILYNLEYSKKVVYAMAKKIKFKNGFYYIRSISEEVELTDNFFKVRHELIKYLISNKRYSKNYKVDLFKNGFFTNILNESEISDFILINS